jgi:hypothetical protein
MHASDISVQSIANCQQKDREGNSFLCRLAFSQKLRANSVLAVKQNPS